MSQLRVENLIKTYSGTTAIDDVTLEVADREFLVLLGPSGCGKSTLLRSIAGLEQIDAGTISIGGVDVTGKRPKDRNISMVFQSYAVFPHLSVGKNIAFGLERQKYPKAEIERRVRSAAELLHIEDLLERPPNNLSGGQRQRVAVARAIAYDADLLLMDEPLSNLDALLRMEMRAELKRLVKEIEATVIYVTHDQTEALSMGDRVAVMEAGRIVQIAPPIEIYDQPATEFIAGFIGNPPMNMLSGTVASDGSAVEIDGGGTLSPPMIEAEPGARVRVGIRAENITIESKTTDGGIPGSILVVEPLGSHNLLTVDCNGVLVKVNVAADDQFAPDDAVWLQASPTKIRLLGDGRTATNG